MSRTTKWTTLMLCACVVLIVASILDAGALYFVSAFLFMLPVGGRVFGAISVRSISARFRSPLPVVVGQTLDLTLESVNLGVLPRFNILVTADLPPGLYAAPTSDGWAGANLAKAASSIASSTAGVLNPKTSLTAVEAEPQPPPGEVSVMVGVVPGEGRAATRCRVRTERRGCFEIGPLTLSHQDPFGLMQVRRRLPTTSEIVVYPRPLGISLMPLVGGDLAGIERTARSRGAVDGADFYGVRPYRAGDEWRRIHWRTTARAGQLMVVEREDLANLSLVIVVDVAADPGDTPSAPLEVLLSLAAQLAEEAMRRITMLDILLLRKDGAISSIVSKCVDWTIAMEALSRIDPDREMAAHPSAALADFTGVGPSVVVLTDRLDERVAAVAHVCRDSSWPGAIVLLDRSEGGSVEAGSLERVLPIWKLMQARSADSSDGDDRMNDYHVEPLARL